MPINYKLYPSCWQQIRKVLLLMAGHCCEQCRVPNHVWIIRDARNPVHYSVIDPADGLTAEIAGLEARRLVLVVLTVAHVNHNITDNRPRNLAVLCQRCHNVLDAQDRAKHRMLTYARRRAEGVLPLPLVWP